MPRIHNSDYEGDWQTYYFHLDDMKLHSDFFFQFTLMSVTIDLIIPSFLSVCLIHGVYLKMGKNMNLKYMKMKGKWIKIVIQRWEWMAVTWKLNDKKVPLQIWNLWNLQSQQLGDKSSPAEILYALFFG